MSLIVQKYGGTSLGSIERIQAVAANIAHWRDQGHSIVAVVSAMSGETKRLLALASALTANPSRRELDVAVSTGEQVAAALLCMALHTRHCPARSFAGWQIPIYTDNVFNKARIHSIETNNITAALDEKFVAVITGFQGVTANHEITTLGRGGSDTSAVAIAAALKADECHIYTDVDGVYTTDPRIYNAAVKLDTLSFEEMLELASMGSKVLQIRAVEFASKYNIPLRVLSSFTLGIGTLISSAGSDTMEKPLISGITCQRNEAKLTLFGVPDVPGVAAQILGSVAQLHIDVDMIIQNTAEDGTTSFTFTVARADADQAEAALGILKTQLNARNVECDRKIAKVSVVGIGMKSHPGVAATAFASLAKEGINIILISTSEIKITAAIDERYLELAVHTLHDAFELEKLAQNDTLAG